MKRAGKWRIAMLGALAIPIIMELIAMWDGDEQTNAYTRMITLGLPQWVFWLGWSALAGWFTIHMIQHYRKK